MDDIFLPGVPREHVLERLAKAGGNEVESGKLSSSESSAALAINTIGWFIPRPADLPAFPGLDSPDWPPIAVDVEYCARFPWSGGRHPWLDAIVETEDRIIGIESKRFEPFRDKKVVSLSEAYDRPVWGDEMQPFERMRDHLRSGEEKFTHLDAAQLVKHAFGLVTEGRRKSKRPALLYLYAEPRNRGRVAINAADIEAHRHEVANFREMVRDAAVEFAACSYVEWLSSWPIDDPEMNEHRQRVVATFDP